MATHCKRDHVKVTRWWCRYCSVQNTQGGSCGNSRWIPWQCLQAASREGHKKVVQILLDAGAPVDAQGGFCGNALQAASRNGHEKVVQILLGEVPTSTLKVESMAVSAGGVIWRSREGGAILLDAGADVNAQDRYGSALHGASQDGHEMVVRALLDAGADVNTQGGYFGNALQAASYGGHQKVVQILLDAGADVNTQGGYYGNALGAASYRNHKKVMEMLLGASAQGLKSRGE